MHAWLRSRSFGMAAMAGNKHTPKPTDRTVKYLCPSEIDGIVGLSQCRITHPVVAPRMKAGHMKIFLGLGLALVTTPLRGVEFR